MNPIERNGPMFLAGLRFEADPSVPRDCVRVVFDRAVIDVWPGGHRFPPILDPGEPVFAWVDGKAVPIASAEDRA